jgi:purine-binding chemotaxis protein CheW
VPNSSEYIDGVINLRGTILPALNMRKMMGFERGEKTANARIIIGRFEGITFGMIVDGITYVVSLLPTEIEVQSLPGKGTGAEFIGGLSKQGAKICGILDLVRVLKHVAGNLDQEDATEGDVEELD